MKAIKQQFTVPFSYTVHFTEDLFGENNSLLSDMLTEHGNRKSVKVYVALDLGVAEAHPSLIRGIETYFQQSAELELLSSPLIVPGGERVKNEYEWIEKILEDVNTF